MYPYICVSQCSHIRFTVYPYAFYSVPIYVLQCTHICFTVYPYAFSNISHMLHKTDSENYVRGGVLKTKTFIVIKIFYRGPYGPSARSNWTTVVQLLLEGWGVGVHISFSKETNSNLCSSEWGTGVPYPLSSLLRIRPCAGPTGCGGSQIHRN